MAADQPVTKVSHGRSGHFSVKDITGTHGSEKIVGQPPKDDAICYQRRRGQQLMVDQSRYALSCCAYGLSFNPLLIAGPNRPPPDDSATVCSITDFSFRLHSFKTRPLGMVKRRRAFAIDFLGPRHGCQRPKTPCLTNCPISIACPVDRMAPGTLPSPRLSQCDSTERFPEVASHRNRTGRTIEARSFCCRHLDATRARALGDFPSRPGLNPERSSTSDGIRRRLNVGRNAVRGGCAIIEAQRELGRFYDVEALPRGEETDARREISQLSAIKAWRRAADLCMHRRLDGVGSDVMRCALSWRNEGWRC